jgi:hypothetical protein
MSSSNVAKGGVKVLAGWHVELTGRRVTRELNIIKISKADERLRPSGYLWPVRSGLAETVIEGR